MVCMIWCWWWWYKESKHIDKMTRRWWYSRWISQNTWNFLIKTNFIHIYSISIRCIRNTYMSELCVYVSVSVAIGMWVGLFVLYLRGWSWWYTTMHFQSHNGSMKRDKTEINYGITATIMNVYINLYKMKKAHTLNELCIVCSVLLVL